MKYNQQDEISATSSFLNKNKYCSEDITKKFIKECYYNNFVSNIADVNVNKYYSKNNLSLKPITPLFCDSLILYGLLKNEDVNCRHNVWYINTSVVSFYNKKVKELFEKYNIKLNHLNVKSKLPISIKKFGNTVKEIEEYERENLNNYSFISIVKIELAEFPFNILLEKLHLILNELETCNYKLKLKDLDITQDCKYVLDKEKLIGYIKDFEEDKISVVNNDHTVGKNCVTFIYNKNGIVLRTKFYNKYICQLTSCGVSSFLGNNVRDMLYNVNNSKLRDTFLETKDDGITRIETTIYSNNIYSMDYYIKTMSHINNIRDSNIFYKTFFKDQFKALEEEIKNSLIIHDKNNNKFTFVYWINILTRKYISVSSNSKKITLESIVDRYAYKDKPCYILEYEDKDGKLDYNIRLFIKHNGDTCISKYNSFFSVFDIELDLKNYGFNYEDLQFYYNKKKPSNSITNNIKEILDREIKHEFVIEKYRNKLEKDLVFEKSKKIEEDILKNLLHKYKEKDNFLREHNTNLEKIHMCFKNPVSIKNNRENYLHLLYIKQTNTRYGLTYIFYTEDNKCYYANAYIKKILNNQIENDYLIKGEYQGILYYYNKDMSRLFTLKLDGFIIINGHKLQKFVLSNNIKHNSNKDDNNTINNNVLKLDYNFINTKPFNCNKMETLKSNSLYNINKISEINCRNKTRYLFSLLEDDNIYISNYFMEKVLDTKYIMQNVNIPFRTVCLRTTPNKHKNMDVVLGLL